MNYENKYYKYKSKYLKIKNVSNQTGGILQNNKKSKMIKIIFVRHGESTENVANEIGEAYDSNNIILTKKGEEQAKKTGKYLFETFGKFDCVISSPIIRCVQTSNLIMKQIDYDTSKIIIDDLIMEIGAHSHPFDGLSEKERETIQKSDEKYIQIMKNINDTTNPYEKYNLRIKLREHIDKDYIIKPNLYEARDNLIVFMNKLRNIIRENDYENILIVSHGGILSLAQKIMCGVNPTNEIYFSEKKYISTSELLGNCSCLYLGFQNNKFTLVAPANTYHLTE